MGAGQPGAAGTDGKPGIGYTTANINSAGNLILTKTDGSTVGVGKVVGPQGPLGPTGVTQFNSLTDEEKRTVVNRLWTDSRETMKIDISNQLKADSAWTASLQGPRGPTGLPGNDYTSQDATNYFRGKTIWGADGVLVSPNFSILNMANKWAQHIAGDSSLVFAERNADNTNWDWSKQIKFQRGGNIVLEGSGTFQGPNANVINLTVGNANLGNANVTNLTAIGNTRLTGNIDMGNQWIQTISQDGHFAFANRNLNNTGWDWDREIRFLKGGNIYLKGNGALTAPNANVTNLTAGNTNVTNLTANSLTLNGRDMVDASKGWQGPFRLRFAKENGQTCLDANQFCNGCWGAWTCDNGTNPTTNQLWYYNPASGQLRSASTDQNLGGKCLDTMGGGPWRLNNCSSHKNTNFQKFEHQLRWGNGNCLDVGSGDRNYGCDINRDTQNVFFEQR